MYSFISISFISHHELCIKLTPRFFFLEEFDPGQENNFASEAKIALKQHISLRKPAPQLNRTQITNILGSSVICMLANFIDKEMKFLEKFWLMSCITFKICQKSTVRSILCFLTIPSCTNFTKVSPKRDKDFCSIVMSTFSLNVLAKNFS